MEVFKLKDDIEEEEIEKRHKEELYTQLERTLRKMEEYHKKKRESQEFALPYLLALGKENIKSVKIYDKKTGDKLWDYFQV